MRSQELKQAIITCLIANNYEMEMSTLVKKVNYTLPFPVHAKEISDGVSSLEQTGTVKRIRSSSGSMAVALQKEPSGAADYLQSFI